MKNYSCVPGHQSGRDLVFNASSPAMESDILVEGFRQAEQTHGVRYMYLVGDGDSSVLSSIREYLNGEDLCINLSVSCLEEL